MKITSKRRGRGLWRWTRRLLIVGLLLGLCARASITAFLPGILERFAASRGLSIQYETFGFSMFSGSLELWKLEVRKAAPIEGDSTPGAEPKAGELLTLLEYMTADVDVKALFGGSLVIHRAEIDGLDVYANRASAESGWSFASVLPSGDGSVDEKPPAQATQDEAEFQGYNLGLPLELRAVRLQHLQLHVTDGARTPAFQTRLELNVRLTDLGQPQNPARLEVFAHGTDWLDALQVRGRFQSQGADLDAHLDCEVRGLHIGRLEAYLETLGLRPTAERLDMGMRFAVKTRGVDGGNQALAIDATIEEVVLRADGEECLALDQLSLGLPHLSPGSIQIETSKLQGVRARASRGAAGHLTVAGLEFVGLPPSTQSAAPGDLKTQTEPLPTAESSSEAPSSPTALAVTSLELVDCQLTFNDQSFQTPRELGWTIDHAQLTDIQLVPGHRIGLQAQMRSPEVLEELVLTGAFVPFGPDKTAQVELQVTGLRPERVQPYLAALGLQSTFESGRFRAKLEAQLNEEADGRLGVDLQVRDILLADRSELFAIEALGVEGLRYSPQDGSVHLREVLWKGTRVALRRDSAGELHFFGLATGASAQALVAAAPAPRGPEATRSAPQATTTQPEPSQSATTAQGQAAPKDADLPRVTVERIAWTDTSFQFADETFSPARELKLEDLGFELRGLDLGGAKSSEARPPAVFKLWFKAAGLAQELELTGTLATTPGPLNIQLAATGRGRELSYEALAPWLVEQGIEPLLQHGELDVQLSTRLAQTSAGLEGNLRVQGLRFAEGEQTFLSLEELHLPSWTWGDGGLRNAGLEVRGPLLAVERDASGALLALGARLPASTPQTAARGTSASNSSATPPQSAAPSSSEQAAVAVEPSRTAPMSFALGHVSLKDARIAWEDAAVPGGVATSLRLGLDIPQLTYGPAAPGSPFALDLEADGGLGRLTCKGELGLTPERVSFTSQLDVREVRAGVFAAYLPPGLRMPLDNGELTASFSASFEPRKTGDGFSVAFGALDIDLRPAGAAHTLLALEQLRFNASRLDPVAAHFAIDEVLLTGLELDVRKSAEGSLQLLGLALEPDSKKVVQDVQAPKAQPTAGGPASASEEVAVTQASATTQSAAPIPTVLLGALDVGIAHLRFLDESVPGAQPFDGSLRLSIAEALTLIAPEAQDLPPLVFTIDGAATPIMEQLLAKITLTPFQAEPGLHFQLEATGLRGLGITEVFPELESQLDGSGLEGGRFETAFAGHLNLRRRSPVDFDLSTGFGLELEFERFGFVPEPDAEPLLALKSLNASVKSIRPGSGAVHVERIELVEPKLHITKSKEGIHLLGLTLMTASPPEVAESAQEGGTEIAAEVPAENSAELVAGSEEAPNPSAQLRLDEFLISGADFSFVDNSVEPPMHLPITDMDMELKRFSTRTLSEPEPFRFRATLYGGDVSLPKRELGGNLIGGILGSVGSVFTGSDDKPMESRPVFDEILLRGNLSLGPQPKGWTQLRVRALELPTFAGPALESGISIGDGLLNETAMLHFDGKGGMRIASNTTISYLSLSEPADGPISSYLRLPAPIDTVLFVLRDEKGDQNIPLNLTIGDNGLSMGAVMGAVGTTLGTIIGDAIAASPMKIIGGVIDLAGFEDEPLELNGDEVALITFHAGDVQPPRSLTQQAAPLLKLLRSDPSLYLVVEHQLSAGDLACSDVLANPPAEECLALAEQLRRKKIRLAAQRSEQVAALRGAFSLGDLQLAEESRTHLRQVDLEIGATESALDRVFELTRPGAERGRARRARGTALEVAGRRMEAVTRELLAAPITGIGTRVDARRPRFGVTPDLERGTIKISVHRRQ